MRVLGLIPARGGSKGVPRKNVRPLGGKPLLQWTAEAALGAKSLARVVLSTEDEEIAAVGRSCGVDVPFMRPEELAADDTPTLPVVQHALGILEERGERYDAVCLLQPTSPFRNAGDIDGCVELLASSGADSVVSVLPVPVEYNPHWVYFGAPNGDIRLSTGEAHPIPRRQALPAAWHREGSVYVTRRDVVMSGSLYGARTVGYVVDGARSVNIDTPSDWTLAQTMLPAGVR
ncbi:MAG TPA: acylneuraminate cytidylyltransferase family protein [Gemmatimonadaceae bacterium]